MRFRRPSFAFPRKIFESLGGNVEEQLFDQLDADGDGEVTFKEFKTALRGYRTSKLKS